MSTPIVSTPELQIKASVSEAQSSILTKEALRFLGRLAKEFEPRRQELLGKRKVRQQEIDARHFPEFLTSTAGIRKENWTEEAPIPKDLQDRRVELPAPWTADGHQRAQFGPQMSTLADFEDSNSPTWQNNVDGWISRDAVNRSIGCESGGQGG